MKRTRTHYDTTVAYLFMTGNDDLLPLELRNAIPASTKATFRNYAPEKFFGFEQRTLLDEGIRRARLGGRYRHLKKVLLAVEAIYIALSDMLAIIKVPLYQVKQHRETMLDIVQQYRNVIGLDKLLSVFKISRSTYQNWLLNIKVKCSASFFDLCVRKYGTQLLKPQVELIKKTLISDEYKHWPVASIAYYFQRMDWLHASVNTWYKYQHVLGIKRSRILNVKKTIGLESSKPNEYWHIDITYFTTKDGIKHCIYFLSDNFSRKILAWRLALEVNWKYVKECIQEAYQVATHLEDPLNLDIVTDGGPENTHHSLDNFIESLVGNIKKVIALKDIQFSNSPAEAKHRTFKSYYADQKKTENTKQLIEKIITFVTDFNSARPNHPLKGFTPDEVYFDKKPSFDFVELRKQDAIKRKEIHQNSPCKGCELVNH